MYCTPHLQILSRKGCQAAAVKPFSLQEGPSGFIPCLGSVNLRACGDGRGLLIYFMLGSKLMHFIWNIALSFLGIRVRSLAVTSPRHLQTTGWLHALVCSTGSISLGPLQSKTAAFLVSDWFLGSHSTPVIGHTITSPTCTDLCCTPGCSLPSSGCYPWLLIGQTAVMKGSDWPSFWLCILLSASHPGSGSADQERLRDIWQNKSTISKSKHQIDKHFYLIVLVFLTFSEICIASIIEKLKFRHPNSKWVLWFGHDSHILWKTMHCWNRLLLTLRFKKNLWCLTRLIKS